MWRFVGLLVIVLVHRCSSQGPRPQTQEDFMRMGPSSGGGGFMSGPGSSDVSVRVRGGGFDRGAGRGDFGTGSRRGVGGFSPAPGGGGFDRGAGTGDFGTGGGRGSDGFTPMPGGGGLGSTVAVGGIGRDDCPQDQRIEGFTCAGEGVGVSDCPADSRCVRDGSGGSYCCWNSAGPVEAPCEDPKIEGSTFVQCVPGDQNQSCRDRCYSCESLGRGMNMGLCCPQTTRRGCESSSPMRNQFEAARQRIMGMGSSGSSTDVSRRGRDRGSPGRSPDRRFGPDLPPMGMDFGMTSSGGGFRGDQDVICPNGDPPLGSCTASSPCRRGQACLENRNGAGACCPLTSGGTAGMGGSPGMTGMPGMPGGSGRLFTESPGMPGSTLGSTGMVTGMTRPIPMCSDGRPAAGSCSARSPCRRGLTCVPMSDMDGMCCQFGSEGIGGGPEMPGMPGAPGMAGMPGAPEMAGMSGAPGMAGMPDMSGMPGAPGMSGMPGSPGMSRMPGMPGMPGVPRMSGMPDMPGMPFAPGMFGPGMPGETRMSGLPGMSGRRIPLGLRARRRDLLMRDPRRRLLALRGRGARRPFGPVISGRGIRGPMF